MGGWLSSGGGGGGGGDGSGGTLGMTLAAYVYLAFCTVNGERVQRRVKRKGVCVCECV